MIMVKEESEKTGLKFSIQKTKIMEFGPITSWQIDEETIVTDIIFLGSKITVDDYSHMTTAMTLKDVCSLGEKL